MRRRELIAGLAGTAAAWPMVAPTQQAMRAARFLVLQLSFATMFCALWAGSLPAAAQDWPAKPVRLVSPFAPGGSSDILGRLIAEQLSARLHQQFYVENRGGAGGLIGSALVANAAADGTTFLISSIGTHVTAPATNDNPGYDPISSFTHVAYIGGPPIVIVVHPSLGARTFPELVALLRNGRDVSFVSPGPGTIGHLIGAFLAERENAKLSHIAYKGSGQAINDLVAGHVPLGSITWAAALPQIRGGTVIPLAVSSARRLPGFPDVPTLNELGYPDLVVSTWFGISAPAGLPPAIAVRMNEEVNRALDAVPVLDRLAAEGVERIAMTPAEFTALIRRDITRWGPLAKRLMQTGSSK
jgi:tripartite-type tricarboxylate transporter receptor subunit TctC